MRRLRRLIWEVWLMVSRARRLVVAAVVLVALAAGTTVWIVAHPAAGTKKTQSVPTATARVIRTTLSSTTQLSGTLGYGASYSILYQRSGGTLTGLPDPGTIVHAGQELFEINGVSTFLFYGSRPEWRDLRLGVPPGPDVEQLEQNLTTLGYAAGLSMRIDNTFTSATARALERWQRAVGYPANGQLLLGVVSYRPGPVRVEQAASETGAQLGSGQPVLTTDSAVVSVTADVPTAQTFLVHRGDKVTVTLPSGKVVAGVVGEISRVATNDTSTQASAGQQGNAATVPVTVSLDDPSSIGALDEAPVTVNVTDRTIANVLAVPITALVALSGGGYGLYVVNGRSKKLIAATPGLFSTTLVQVSALGLRAGDLVQVPSS
jgi:peptidoglycan hydrolase-like protein with peptidoglycan-binding domain